MFIITHWDTLARLLLHFSYVLLLFLLVTPQFLVTWLCRG
jgi:hypothetical protein